LEKKRVASPELLQQLLLRRVGPVKVGRNGVQYHGVRFGQYDLGHLQTQEVYLAIDDQDISKVTVWDEKGQFLALAHANQRMPNNADRELLRAAIKRQRQYSKALRNAQPARAAIHEDIPATMFRLQKERAEALAASRHPPTPPAPTISPIRSPLEKELKRVKEAVEADKPENRAARRKELENMLDREVEIFAEDDAKRDAQRAEDEARREELLEREEEAFGLKDWPCKRPLPEEQSEGFTYESLFKKPITKLPSLSELLGETESAA
jgi:hypothetical protein